MSLRLLARHQTERVKVGVGFLIIVMDMDLWVVLFTDHFLGPQHHSPFHTRIGDVGNNIEHYKCLFKFYYLLICALV